MSAPYFSDRELGERPRVKEEIDKVAWGGIVALVKSHILDGSFGFRYPQLCQDDEGIFACDEDLFSQAVNGEIPDIDWPPKIYYGSLGTLPSTLAILDFIEFCFRSIAQPIQHGYHSYFKHYHLEFDQEEGQQAFRQDVNRILARNGLTYAVDDDGAVRRLAPEVLRKSLQTAIFQTGDAELDFMLETARGKFLSPDFAVRREALEELWDTWERLKTIEPPAKKPASAKALLDRAADEPAFQQLREDEARALTDAGNSFQIRHSEVNQVPLRVNEHIDYMFHRMFALVRLLLRMTGRGG